MVCVCLCVCFWWAIQVMVQWKTMSWTQTNFWKESRPSLEGKFPFRTVSPSSPTSKNTQVILNDLESRFPFSRKLANSIAMIVPWGNQPPVFVCFCWGVGSKKHQQGNTPIWRPRGTWFSTWWFSRHPCVLELKAFLEVGDILPSGLDVFWVKYHPRGVVIRKWSWWWG